VEADRLVHAGGWTAPDGFGLIPALDVHGATLGILGYGRVGKAVARRAQGFGMRVIEFSIPSEASDEFSESVEFDDLLRNSDIVTVHVPLTKDTAGFLGRREFEMMKTTAVLVNASRGRVIDEPALVDALRDGRIAGAGLDVVVHEPIEASNPLLNLPNCIVLPHIASATVTTRSRMVGLAVDGVIAALRGETPQHLLNADILGAGAP
jgi:phosphoglycerate dehydrogenase-like enzyme